MRIAVYSQIFLIITMSFSFAYLINEASKNGNINDIVIVKKKSYSMYNTLLKALSIFNKLAFRNNFVSAIEGQDLQTGAYTCPIDKDGSICQEYASSDCAEKCAVVCLPTTREQSAMCKPGTCYDPFEGTCQAGATKAKCEQDSGRWFIDPFGNIPECQAGCCILGNNAYFGTKRQCERDSAALGLKKDFRPEINTELDCIIMSKSQEEGACVFENEFLNTCKFTTKLNCLQNIKGKFYTGILCSSGTIGMNQTCKAQQSVKCVEGKDEVYWFDSCGNQENIYEGASLVQKAHSANDGKILAKNNSCSLIEGNNFLANQKTCGNCNYLLGSKCGMKTADQFLSGITADAVCRNLNCVDESGKERKHGESWCAYQGSVGIDKTGVGKKGELMFRGTDTVGSRNFRKVCIDGEIRTEPCADYRNEICIESQTDIPGGKFSSAACRINRAYQCYEFNSKEKQGQCEKNPDCFIKHVEVGSSFKFDICAPKYAPGFNLEDRGEGVSAICSYASQKCQVVYVKGIGGWDCKANCECETAKFAEQMNDLCISLGDCGSKANYLGDFSKNSKIFKSNKKDKLGKEIGAKSKIRMSNNYINGLIKYADEKLYKNKFIDAGNLSKFYAELGIPGTLGTAGTPEDKTAGVVSMATTTSGMMGTAWLLATKSILVINAAGQPAGAAIIFKGSFITSVNPGVAAAGSALAGAAIGFAVVSMLLQWTGVGRGLPPAITYGLMAAGAIGGAIIGASLTSAGSSALASIGLVPIVGWIILIVVIIIIVIMKLMGIGDIKKIYYTFQCNPWQAPTGGAKCSQCGADGFQCSVYSCQSLGQTCQLINEETGNAECISVAEDDASAPIISPMKELLPQGYSAEQSDTGVRIKSSLNDGCIANAYEAIPFGISLNEPGQCVIAENHTSDFDEMDQSLDFGLFLRNHSLPLMIPSLDSLGIESFNPNAKAEQNIYLRCQDKNGNKNVNEYVVNYCVKPGNDTTAPVIITREPYLETVAFGITGINASVFTNEPADCKWDASDKTYYQMQNNFTCLNDFEQRELYGWRCLGEFPISSKNESLFYVRCLDQPWENDSTKRNPSTQSYQLKFNRVANPLKIDSINVDGQNYSFDTQIGSVEIIVKTSGGLDGTARCGYKWGNDTIDFYETWTREHKQVFPTYSDRANEITVVCEDLIGNIAEKTARFTVKFDNEAPKVTRIYAQSGTLTLVTDEESTCYYSLNRQEQCLFDIENASTMNGEDVRVHSTSFDAHGSYYIKCVDKFNHYPGDCSIIVREGNYETQEL